MPILFASAKVVVLFHSHKLLPIFLLQNSVISFFSITFAIANRDVAQLVAHYVRDVGVASSSPVIPTKASERG